MGGDVLLLEFWLDLDEQRADAASISQLKRLAAQVINSQPQWQQQQAAWRRSDAALLAARFLQEALDICNSQPQMQHSQPQM
jgi:hypothetical protein